MLHFVLWLAYLIDSSKVIKVGGKQKPYEMWRNVASPLASSLAREYGGSAAACPLTNPASYAGYYEKLTIYYLLLLIYLLLNSWPIW